MLKFNIRIIRFSVPYNFLIKWFHEKSIVQISMLYEYIHKNKCIKAISFVGMRYFVNPHWWPIIICSGSGLSVSYAVSIVLHFQISFNKVFGLEAILCLLTSSPWLIKGQLDSSAHCVLCSLLWCMRDMHALTSISVVAAPKGGLSLCSAAGQAHTNSEVLWLYQTSWLCICDFCGLQRSSAPHLKMSFNSKLLGV